MKKFFLIVFAMLIAGFVSAQQNNATKPVETKTPVKSTELKKEITDHIARDYAGYRIGPAFKVEKGNITTYKVTLTKDTLKTTLIYDDKGAFVKAIPHKGGQQTAKKPQPNQKTTPAATKTGTKGTATTPKK
jgi:hypothetical protein